MAVYTKIDKSDIKLINTKFKIEKIISFQGIKQGIENTNYLLKSKDKKFILTIFEKRVSNKEITFFMKLMDKLNSSKINCPKPLKTKNDSYLIKLKKKTACIVSFLEGKDKKKLSIKDCYAVGKITAQMHLVTEKLKLYRKNSMGIKNLNSLLKSIKFKDNKFSKIDLFLKNNLKNINKYWPKKLPNGIIHGDLFIDNIFFKKNKFSGFIDFYFSCNDFYAYEIAICLNAWCFELNNNEFNPTKAKYLLKSYNEYRKFSIEEVDALPLLTRASALRYLLTRLIDFHTHADSELILKKNPNEYLLKLKFHQTVKKASEYGL